MPGQQRGFIKPKPQANVSEKDKADARGAVPLTVAVTEPEKPAQTEAAATVAEKPAKAVDPAMAVGADSKRLGAYVRKAFHLDVKIACAKEDIDISEALIEATRLYLYIKGHDNFKTDISPETIDALKQRFGV
jgi:hypothetical protein